jgi:hypothetical protein
MHVEIIALQTDVGCQLVSLSLAFRVVVGSLAGGRFDPLRHHRQVPPSPRSPDPGQAGILSQTSTCYFLTIR